MGIRIEDGPEVGTGDASGPTSSTDNAVARFDGTTGKLIQNSTVTIADNGNINTSGTITASNFSGSSSGTNTGDGANAALSNLVSVAVNADIAPGSADTLTVGSYAKPFDVSHFRSAIVGKDAGGSGFQLYDGTGGGSAIMFLNNANATMPSGTTARTSVKMPGGFSGALGFYTDGLNDLRIETGNNGAGASNNIVLQTGTATTTRGIVNVNALGLSVNAKLALIPDTLQTLAAGFTVAYNKTYTKIDSSADRTSDATTAIAAGTTEGQTILLDNRGSFNITIKNAAGTELPNAMDYIIGPKGTLSLIWTGSNWRCTSASAN